MADRLAKVFRLMGVFKSRQIGKYQLQAELGRGGFGSVYRAYDPTVGRLVAIKVLTASGDPQLLNRFKNEAASAGNLRHRNILTIYDFGEHEGLPYIVMEFLEGEDLQQVITQKRELSLLDKVSIMLQVADGLHCAHRSGVVHRDVKPGNIRLLPDGSVKIMDFGIARMMAGSPGGARITRQGHVIGTLLYMAPEQVRGGEVDFLCDIFAFGITYYELLTGKHPFTGSDPRSVFYRITSEDPEPIRNLVPDCPEALERIVNRALHKERDLRYQSLREVQLDSESLLIELRQERAATLLAEANRLYNSAQLDSAQAVLNEAFDLDPGNRTARQLRETIQHQLLRRVIEPKIKALLDKGNDLLGERRFSEAIEAYESAVRLDRENAHASQRLAQAREMQSLSRESARIVAEARREFSRNNLEAALQTLPEALEHDPGNPDASQLLEDVRKEFARREKARENSLNLRRARDLLAGGSFDDALRLLDGLETDERLGDEVRALADEIRARKQTHQRQQKFQEELAVAREQMATGQHDKAIRRLERLMAAYPEEPEATKLFILAHKKLAAQRKAESLERLGNELAALTEARRYDRAIELVNDALRDYPAEQRLIDALRDIETQREEHRRSEACSQALEEAANYVAASDPAAAEQVLAAALARYPQDEHLSRALADARSAVEQQRRNQAINRIYSEVEDAAGRADFVAAMTALDGGEREFGADPRLTRARETVLAAKAEWERAEAIRQALDSAGRLKDDPEQAIQVLEATAQRYPEAETVRAALATARETLAFQQREAAIQSTMSEAQAVANRRDYAAALASLDRALATFPDDRLHQLRREIENSGRTWERSEAIRIALEDSTEALDDQQPERAVTILETAAARFSAAELEDALARARDAAAVHERDAAVATALRAAGDLSGRHRFDEAIAELDRALDRFPGDPRLTESRQEVVTAQADWDRSETIRRALDEAVRQTASGATDAALASIETALGKYPNEDRLVEMAEELRADIEQQRRERAIQNTLSAASALREALDFDHALSTLDRAAAELGPNDRLADLRENVARAQAEWKRSEEIDTALALAERQLAAGDPQAAVELLDAAKARFPGDERLAGPLDAARRTLETALRERAVAAVCAEASAQLHQRDFDRALDLVRRALADIGHDSQLDSLKARIIAERLAWHREETLRAALELSREKLDADDPAAAVQMLEAANSRYPGEPGIEAALDQARRESSVQTACREAESSLGSSDYAHARELLDACIRAHGHDERLTAALDLVRSAEAARQREGIVESALAESARRLAGADPDGALDVLYQALQSCPGDDRLESAAAEAARLVDEGRRNAAIDAACASAAGQSERGEFESALSGISSALAAHGDAPRLLSLQDEIARAQAGAERLKEVGRAIQSASEKIAAGQPSAAVELLDTVLARWPDDAQLIGALEAAREAVERQARDRAVESVAKQVRQLSKRHDYAVALAQIDAALANYPDDPRLFELKNTVVAGQAEREREQTVRRALSRAAELQAANRTAEALQALDEALRRCPSDPRLLTARAEIDADNVQQRKREQLDENLAEAIALIERDPETAVRMLEALRADFPDDPRINSALESAPQRLPDRARETSIFALCQETREHIDERNFGAALQTVERGLDTFGDEAQLARMRETVLASKADWDRAEGIRLAVEEADRFVAQGQLESAVESLVSATRVWGPEDRLTQAIATTREALEEMERRQRIAEVCRSAESAISEGRLDEAVRLLDDAQRGEGPAEDFHQIRARIAAEREKAERAEAARRAMETAESHLQQNDPEGAVSVLDACIARYKGASGLAEARARAAQAVVARKKRLAADTAFGEIEADLTAGNIKAAQKRLQSARKTVGAHPRLDELQAAIERARAQREEPRQVASPAQPFSPPRSAAKRQAVPVARLRTMLLGAAAALVVVALGALLKFAVFSKGEVGVVAVHAAPPGAIVKVGDQTCASGDCKFELAPGDHRIEVSADGYQTNTQQTTLARGDSRKVTVTLNPLPSTLQVSANFLQGSVTVNGRAERLQDGQFTLSAVQPGRHDLRVAGAEGSASLIFESAPASLPTLNTVTADGVEAVGVAAFGKQATVYCATCSGSVLIDDRPAGEFQDGKLHLDALTSGTHRVHLKGQTGERNLIFSAGGAPAVNLALTSSKNSGTLVVDAAEDGVSVTIDGRRYPGRTLKGQLRLNLDAGSHAVQVSKDGYRADPAEARVTIVRGDQFEARFRLSPQRSRLFVADAVPGASVRVDGAALGQVRPDGTFTAEVAPGQHRVEFVKDGFAPLATSINLAPGAVVRLARRQSQMAAISSSGGAARTATAPPPAAESPAAAPAPAPDPAALEAAEWQRVSRNPNTSEVEEFLRKYPSGASAAEARRALERLEWTAVDRGNRAALQVFLAKHPAGSFSSQAAAEIARLDNEAAARANQQRDAERLRGEREQIRGVLRSYSDAYARKDDKQIVALWPSIPAKDIRDVRASFKDFQSIKVELDLLGEPDVAGAVARVQCRRTTVAADRNGPRSSQGMVTVQFQKRDGRWIIDSIH